MKFLNLVIDHSRATLSIMLLILIAGAGSRLSMPVELNPNVTLPVVMVEYLDSFEILALGKIIGKYFVNHFGIECLQNSRATV